jgi:hypothetical protein
MGHLYGDTWLYRDGTWSEFNGTSSPPPSRFPSLAWDAADQVVLLFGGSTLTADLNDTWEFQYPTGWTELHPSVAPPARRSAGMAFDVVDDAVVLWGGHNSTPGYPVDDQQHYTMDNDTWEFRAGAWHQILTTHAPLPSSEPTLVADPLLGGLVEFGGYDQLGPGGYIAWNQTWLFRGGEWTNLTLPLAPNARDGAAGAFDPALGGVVIYGGQDEGVANECLMNDTWVLAGTPQDVRWVRLAPSGAPPLLDSAGAVYDPVGGAFVLFGGTGSSAGMCASSQDMTWYGSTWTLTGGAAPPATGPCSATVAAENAQDDAIGSAIRALAGVPNATVCLAPGNFSESFAVSNASGLTILGDGPGETVLNPATAVPYATRTGASGSTVVLAQNDSRISLQAFSLEIHPSGPNETYCPGTAAVVFAGSSGTVTGLTVEAAGSAVCAPSDGVVVSDLAGPGPGGAAAVTISGVQIPQYGSAAIVCAGAEAACSIENDSTGDASAASSSSGTIGVLVEQNASARVQGDSIAGDGSVAPSCLTFDARLLAAPFCRPGTSGSSVGVELNGSAVSTNVSGDVIEGVSVGIWSQGSVLDSSSTTIDASAYGAVVAASPIDPTGCASSSVLEGSTYSGPAVGVLAEDCGVLLAHDVGTGTGTAIEAAGTAAFAVSIDSTVANGTGFGAVLGGSTPTDSAPNATFLIANSTFGATGPAGFGVLAEGASVEAKGTTTTGFATGMLLGAGGNGSAVALGDTVHVDGAGARIGISLTGGTVTSAANTVQLSGPPGNATGLSIACARFCAASADEVRGFAIAESLHLLPGAAGANVSEESLLGSQVAALAINASASPTASVAVRGCDIEDAASGGIGIELVDGAYIVDSNVFTGAGGNGSADLEDSFVVRTTGPGNATASAVGNAFVNASGPVLSEGPISGSSADPSVSFGETVTFVETGLPVGAPWWVNGSGATGLELFGAQVLFDVANGTLDWSASTAAPGLRLESPQPPTWVNGSALQIDLDFAPIESTVTFEESGLPAGTHWSVALAGSNRTSNSTTLLFSEPVGSYGYTVGPLGGYTTLGGTANGTVRVNGSGATVDVTFGETFLVTFVAHGLPGGTLWGVSLAGTMATGTSESLPLDLPNGTYPYVLADVPGWRTADGDSRGTVAVEGRSVSVTHTFAVYKLLVAVRTTGLPTGLAWTFTLGNSTVSTKDHDFGLKAANGTYPFEAVPIAGYHLAVGTYVRSVTVSGSGLSVVVAFAPTKYAVTFEESGVPARSEWTVWVDGAFHGGSKEKVLVQMTNGTYNFTASIQGSDGEPVTGDIEVVGAPLVETVVFA